MPMPDDKERQNLLHICRAVMPGVAGVVLSTAAGHVVAHETTHVPDPYALAQEAAAQPHPGTQTSALIQRDGSLYLVVFVPEPLLEQWQVPAIVPA